MKKVFIAGASGFTGRAIAQQDAHAFGLDLLLQIRPKSPNVHLLAGDQRTVEIDLTDQSELMRHLSPMDVVIQLIGTIKRKFDGQTNYQTVDYGTTVALLKAAQNTSVQHFILVSSVGASTGLGPYLAWKRKTEAAVIQSGIPCTIVRPGPIVGDKDFPDRPQVARIASIFGGLAQIPGGGVFNDLKPMGVQVLARCLMQLSKEKNQKTIYGGDDLWQLARRDNLK